VKISYGFIFAKEGHTFMALKSLDFREKRKASWEMLEKLLKRIEEKGLQSLSPEETMLLAKLYRTASSSLYIARNISLDRNLHEYLEGLVTKGYLAIYCTKPVLERPIAHFVLEEFPQVVRKYFWHHLTAFILVFLGIFTGYFACQYDAAYYFVFVDRGLAGGRTPYSTQESLASVLKTGRDADIGTKTLFASQLFTHNTKIGFLCFTLGIVAGLPTLYLLFYNGGMLGAMSYIYHMNDLAIEWWAWILPHGITEFLAIILCGGAGLMLAWALVYPGKYGRRYQLKIVGRDAGVTIMGTVILFLFAGVIEGLFRQTDLPEFPRYLVALITLVFWIYYFGFMQGNKNGERSSS
jgi:uncharacterized membrane protein SpoIIM required for sporulation